MFRAPENCHLRTPPRRVVGRAALFLCLMLGLLSGITPAAAAPETPGAMPGAAGESFGTPVGPQGARGAAAPEPGGGLWRAIGWSLLILVGAIVALLLAMWFRRQIIGQPSRLPRESGGFTLSDLRRLHQEGKISDEEYEKTRARIVDAAQRTLAEDAQDRVPPTTPQTKDVDLIREVE